MNNEKENMSASVTTEDKPPMNAFQRLFGIFFSPIKTFEDINRKPSFILPLAIIIIFSVVVTMIVMPKLDMERAIEMQMEKAGKEISDEQMDTTLDMAGKVGKIVGYIGAAVGPIIVTLIIAGLYFGIIRLWRAGSTFSGVYSVTVHSFLISILKSILASIVLLRLDDKSLLPGDAKYLLPSNLAAFLSREEGVSPLYAVASQIDFFTIWIIILTILGLSVVSKLRVKQSAAIVLILWLIWIAILAVLAAVIPS